VIGGHWNVHVVRGEYLSSFVTSMVQIVSSGGLIDSWNVSSLGACLFLHSMLEINFWISLRIKANLRDLL